MKFLNEKEKEGEILLGFKMNFKNTCFSKVQIMLSSEQRDDSVTKVFASRSNRLRWTDH